MCKKCYTGVTNKYCMENREKYTEYTRNWRRNNQSKVHNKNLKKYGIDLRIYTEILESQNGCCAICYGQTTKRTFDVDHCHLTGKVRGLLCSNCNRGLGFLKDDPAVLSNASMYLIKSKTKSGEF